MATEAAGLINGPLVNNLGDPGDRVLVPMDTTHSVLLQKMSTRGAGQMPPLASVIADPAGVALITEWINAGLSTVNLVAPKFTAITLASDGEVQLTFTGQTGTVYRVEFSTNLKDWSSVAGVETDPSGIGHYSASPGMTNLGHGFYRIAWP